MFGKKEWGVGSSINLQRFESRGNENQNPSKTLLLKSRKLNEFILDCSYKISARSAAHLVQFCELNIYNLLMK